MIFRRISYRIALQFMAFVFVLLIINGLLFLAADFGNEHRRRESRLSRTAEMVLARTNLGPDGVSISLPPMLREQVRIIAADGDIIYAGDFFEEMPFQADEGITHIRVERQPYAVMTIAIHDNDSIAGYVQIAEEDRVGEGELPVRALLYLVVSGAISALTFSVGLFFARRSLKPAEQMVERLEQFTQDASHELRTPLATLNSSIDLALKTEKYREGLLSAKDDVKEIATLVERLLELARLDTFVLQRKPVDLSALVEDAVERHRPLAKEHNISIEATLKPRVIVKGDDALLRQVLGNFLSNAIKFSKPEGGVIHVNLTDSILIVEDHGIGIASDALPNIFNRFFQAESSRSNDGFGLGLALAKRIIELHGWSVGVASVEGEKTTFSVRFVS